MTPEQIARQMLDNLQSDYPTDLQFQVGVIAALLSIRDMLATIYGNGVVTHEG